MAVVDLVMPKLGESIMEATILKWHKKSGDQVKMDETVLEIATDKVDSEVPSTAEGIIEETFFQVNDVVPIGTVIARIKTRLKTILLAPLHRLALPVRRIKCMSLHHLLKQKILKLLALLRIIRTDRY